MTTMRRGNAFAAFAAALEQAELPDDIEVTSRVLARVERKKHERAAAVEAERRAARDALLAEATRRQKVAAQAEQDARAAALGACELRIKATAAYLEANTVMPVELNAQLDRLFAETEDAAPRLRVGSRAHGLRGRMKDVAIFVGRLTGEYGKHAVRVHLYGKPGEGRDSDNVGRPCLDWYLVANPPGDDVVDLNNPAHLRRITTLEV